MPGHLHLNSKDGQTPGNLKSPPDSVPFPSEFPIQQVILYVSPLTGNAIDSQWGFQFQNNRCVSFREVPAELLSLLPVPAGLIHIHYFKHTHQPAPLLTQWADVLYYIQLKGAMQISGCTKTSTQFAIRVPTGHSLILPMYWFTQYSITHTMLTGAASTLMVAIFKPRIIRRILKIPGKLPQRLRQSLLHTMDIVSVPHCIAQEKNPHETSPVRCISFNVQISIRDKTKQLHVWIKEMEFPDIVMLQEIGKLPSDFMFHPLYMAFHTHTDRNSLGVAILLRRVLGIQMQEQHFSPDHRAIVVRFLYNDKPFQVVNLYLKSKAEAHEIRATLNWVAPFLISAYWYTVVGGDFNQNPGWDNDCPISSPARTEAILDAFLDTNIHPVKKQSPGPTWVSAQGHVGALDHFMVSVTHTTPPITQVIHRCSFPSDHFPLILSIYDVTPLPPPECTHATNRYVIPVEITATQLAHFQRVFDKEYTQHASDTLDITVQSFTHAILQAATQVFGQPCDAYSTPMLVQKAMQRMQAYITEHPQWWLHITQAQQLQKHRSHIWRAWDMIHLENKIRVSLNNLGGSAGAQAPRKPLYRKIFRQPYNASLEPTYVSQHNAHADMIGLVALDQFRQRHLSPPLYMNRNDILQWVQWDPPQFPPLTLTVSFLRKVLKKFPRSTPFRNLLEARMVNFLSDSQLLHLVQLYNTWLAGGDMDGIYWGDFYALPNKLPHGPIANARPLLNFHTLWKIFSASIKKHVTHLLCQSQVIPVTQFALWGKSSANDVLRVIHDHVNDRWYRNLTVFLVLDDIRHAFGSVQHPTLEQILRLAGFHERWITIIMGAATKSKIFMGGKKGVKLAITTFRAGIAQGCPVSALIFCLLLELRIAIITHQVPVPISPGGRFLRVTYMDDTTFVLECAKDMQQLLDRQMTAGLYTHLHTSVIKLTGIVASMIGGKVQYHGHDFRAGGSTLQLLDGNEYARLLGRHVLPHIFHRQDCIKLLSACRRASIALRYERLPANYPLIMYSASAGGSQRWIAGVRPPAHATMRLCDFAAASAIRSVANWGQIPSASFMQSLQSGWTGIYPATVTMLHTFVITIMRQAGHLNPLVRKSVTHGIWRAFQNFHPGMPCVPDIFGKMCPSHSTDYDRFLKYTHHMNIRIHVPAYVKQIDEQINMYKCTHDWQAVHMHEWMTAGYKNLPAARKAGWPIPDWMFCLPNVDLLPSVPCPAILPDIKILPKRPFFVTDGSRLSDGRVGGALAICDYDTMEYTVYPIHCPISLDHSFAIEMYVAWVTLLVRKKLGTQDGVWYTKSDTYTDSKSYVTALQSDTEQTVPILRDLLQACKQLSQDYQVPVHIYSHRKGTLLDIILDSVDSCAKETALSQVPSIGWISELQEPQITFSCEGQQFHNWDKYVHTKLTELYCKSHDVEYCAPQPVYDLYANALMNGHIQWNTHLHTVACRQGIWQPNPAQCIWCGMQNTSRHMCEECPYRDVILYLVYSKLAVMIPDVIPSWKHCIPTPWGVWVQRGAATILLHCVYYPGAQVDHISLCINPDGRATTDTTHAMEKLGVNESKQQRLLGFILTTLQLLREATSLPLMLQTQDFAALNGAPMTHFVLAHQHRVPKHSWASYPEVWVVWPHAPLLFLLGNRMHFHVYLPKMRLMAHSLTPVTYWFVTDMRDMRKLQHNVPTVWLIDSVEKPVIGTNLQGTIFWSMTFGYPENQRMITCLVVQEQVYSVKRLRALLAAFQQLFALLGLPHKMSTQDYRLKFQPSMDKWVEEPW